MELSCRGKDKIREKEIIDNIGKWKIKVKTKKTGSYKCKLKYYNLGGDKLKTFKFRMRIDTENPEFTDFADKVYKNKGGKIWWRVKDNRKLKRFKVYFNGKIYKMKIHARRGQETTGSLYIPKDTPSGTYNMKVKVYDRAGNKEVKEMRVIVR